MSFENLKRDLDAYNGRSDLTLEERLALFRSLESDMEKLTKVGLDQYSISSDECQSDSTISSLAWFGNLFQKLYAKNQATVENHTGKLVRHFLSSADSSADSLNKEYEKQKEALGKKREIQLQNAALEKKISQIKAEVQDLDKVQRRYDELLEEKSREEARLAALVPFDIEATRQELDAIKKEIEDKQSLYSAQRLQLDAERKELKQQIDSLQDDNRQLDDEIAMSKKTAQSLIEQKQLKKAELAALNDESIRREIDALDADISSRKAAHENDIKRRTEMQIELSRITESNENFNRNYIDSVQQELDLAQVTAENLEQQRHEKVEELKELTDKIKEITEALPQLKDQIDVQMSNFQAASANLTRSQERLNELKNETEQKEENKKELDDELLSLEEKELIVKTQISTLTIQTLPKLKEEIALLCAEQEKLQNEEGKFSTEIEELSKAVEEKTLAVAEATRIREEKQSELGRLSADLDSLYQQNCNLEKDLSEGNPEETRQKLQSENARLIEELKELEGLKQQLSEKQHELEVQEKNRNELSSQVLQTKGKLNEVKAECEALTQSLKGLNTEQYNKELNELKKRQEFLTDVADALKSLKQQMFPAAEFTDDTEIIRQGISEIGKKLDIIQEQISKVRKHFKENLL